jgi:hypothetical protein
METTTILNIPNDILTIIISQLVTSNDMLSFRHVNTDFNAAICFMQIKIAYMNNKKLVTRRIQLSCINDNCLLFEERTMETTTFYYPKELIEPHDHQGDPYGINFEFKHRENICNICKDGSSIERYIPYCEECMMNLVNFGTRDDGLDVPYYGINGHNNF